MPAHGDEFGAIQPGLLHWSAYRDTIGADVHSYLHVPSGTLLDPMEPLQGLEARAAQVDAGAGEDRRGVAVERPVDELVDAIRARAHREPPGLPAPQRPHTRPRRTRLQHILFATDADGKLIAGTFQMKPLMLPR